MVNITDIKQIRIENINQIKLLNIFIIVTKTNNVFSL